MARTAATKIEDRERARAITVLKKLLDIFIDLIVKHVIAAEHFFINRPRIEKVFFSDFGQGVALRSNYPDSAVECES